MKKTDSEKEALKKAKRDYKKLNPNKKLTPVKRD